jgi:phage nucleotide-binding protein
MSLAELAGIKIEPVGQKSFTTNMLIYGESGAGKTRLAGSADEVPEMRKVLVVDIEGGTLTLRDTFPQVDSVRVKSWDEMQAVYDELERGSHDYQTIIIDSLTEAQRMSMDQVMRKLVEENSDRDPDVPGMREWNINIEQTRKFVRAFRDLPVNTIFTALVQNDVNKSTGQLKRKPSLSGKVKDEVAGFLDVVVYLYIKEINSVNKHLLLCQATDSVIAKDRTNTLPNVLEEPTMQVLWNYIADSKKEAA